METWYRLNLGDASLAGPALDRVGAAISRAHPDTDGRALLFTRHESEGRLHCELVVYVAPAAGDVARALGAVPCAEPAPGDLAAWPGSG